MLFNNPDSQSITGSCVSWSKSSSVYIELWESEN